MAESITYGSYTFPDPTPLVGQSVNPVYVAGKLDHYQDGVELIGNLTGANLSGLHLQKMQMISGLMSEYETLTVSNDDSNKEFTCSKPTSISFSDSDLTTVLPYSVSFESFSSGVFSEYFGVQSPVDNWSFTEEVGEITAATHTVSAQGVKIDNTAPLVNAINFVTGRATGCRNISLFQTGAEGGAVAGGAYLISRTENIDKASNTYGIIENYKYSTSENPIKNVSGFFTSSTQIAFDKDAGLSVNVNASVQGNMDATKNTDGLVDTGMFTSTQATEIAVNAVASSLSDYESGAYSFINRGPKSVSYRIDSGVNKVDYTFSFQDPDNTDQIGNVLHKRTANVSTSKDESIVNISVNGNLSYNGPFDVLGTGDPATGARFLEVDSVFSGVIENSGLLNFAIEALQDFREVGTGYHISGNYVNSEAKSEDFSKDPNTSTITYSASFDNKVDLASGNLTGLQLSIADTKPIEKSGIVPSIGGFAKQLIMKRSAGQWAISATCEGGTGKMPELMDVVSGYSTGVYKFSESSSLNDQTISYNLSRYY